MKEIVFFSLPGNETLTEKLASKLNAKVGKAVIREFPDGESYIRIFTDVKDKHAILICTLNKPNNKILPIYFLSQTLKVLGAKKVCLVAPYLAYMRQDTTFNPGESITSNYFGRLISEFIDCILTVDPHLHRIKSLSEVYNIPNVVIHAAGEISKWINAHVKNPVIIGPDSESKQWVSTVAKKAKAPFIVLNKTRYSANRVKIFIPDIVKYKNSTPILVDDIISTAHTMMETIHHLKNSDMKPPVCIGIHAVFSGNAYKKLMNCGVEKIITCNTILHPSNGINISNMIAKGTLKMISVLN
jgi:ribose-phosphate pyrophosphokinase